MKDAEDEDSLSLEQFATIAEWNNLLVLQQAKWAELLEVQPSSLPLVLIEGSG